MEKLGIYGGTFAPVHNGHIRAALEFRRSFKLDRLLIMPNASPPHKKQPTGDGIFHRLNMLKLVFDSDKFRQEGIEISEFELKTQGTNYTVDTLRHFKSPQRRIYFLCGTDMLLSLHHWKEPESIARLTTLVYARREAHTPELDRAIEKQLCLLKESFGFCIEELNIPPLELSSTLIRQSDSKELYLPYEVADYIKRNGLYK